MPYRYTDPAILPHISQLMREYGLQIRDGMEGQFDLLCVDPSCEECYEPDPVIRERDYASSRSFTLRPDSIFPDSIRWSSNDPIYYNADTSRYNPEPLRERPEPEPGTQAWREYHGVRLRNRPPEEQHITWTDCLNPTCNQDYISTETYNREQRQAATRRTRDRLRRAGRRTDYWARDVTYSPDKKPSRLTRPYGIEIEVAFDDLPFDARYGEPPPMPKQYYGGWLSKTDSSIRAEGGIEAVSPVFRGAGSLAEIIHTAWMLEDEGGEINNYCGFHVTLSTQDPQEQIKVMQFFTLLEEAAFAVSGNYSRWSMSRYSRPMKTGGYYEYIQQGQYFDEKYAAIHSKPGCTEFRYPAGTLDPTQMVLNIGLPQLIIRLAAALGPETIKKMLDQGVNMQSIFVEQVAKARLFTMYGLKLLYAQGWREGGDFWGVAYKPSTPPTYKVKDKVRDHETEITLPNVEDLFRVFKSNVRTWGVSLGIEEEAMSIIHGEHKDTVEETLDVLTGGQPLVLPSAGSLKALMSYE